MLGLMGISLMSGLWAGYSAVPRPITDINGKALAVGDTVKLVGKITAINPTGAHFDAITVQPIHPEGDKNLLGQLHVLDPKHLISGS